MAGPIDGFLSKNKLWDAFVPQPLQTIAQRASGVGGAAFQGPMSLIARATSRAAPKIDKLESLMRLSLGAGPDEAQGARLPTIDGQSYATKDPWASNRAGSSGFD